MKKTLDVDTSFFFVIEDFTNLTHNVYVPCILCFKDSMKRRAVGIWGCTKCKKIVAGGAWVYR